jgi:hypothetical protein
VFISKTPNDLLAIAVGVAAGVVGYLGFWWLAGRGYYGLILPGGLVGIGAGFVLHRSKFVAVVCGILGLVAGVLTEYRYAPFIADGSLSYFLRHVTDLRQVTLIMIAAGAVIGFWGPLKSRVRGSR